MPKQTFYNLPEQKRDTLIRAAKKEFARAPYNEASIANIIKEAEIPRGSFYQYFEDKEDLYHYLLDDLTNKRQVSFIASLERYEGDLFAAIKHNFKEVLSELTDEKENEFFYRNVFTNMDYQMGDHLFGTIDGTHLDKKYETLTTYVNKNLLAIEEEEHLKYMIEIILSIMIKSIVYKFVKRISNEEVYEHFTMQLQLVRNGFSKK